jgi:putative transposase
MDLNRKRVTQSQKFNILTAHIEKGTPISELARLHGISPVTIYQWKRNMADKPKDELEIAEVLKELNQLRKDKDKLLKALGEAQIDNQCLKDINEFLKKKSESKLLKQPKNSSKKKKASTRKRKSVD